MPGNKFSSIHRSVISLFNVRPGTIRRRTMSTETTTVGVKRPLERDAEDPSNKAQKVQGTDKPKRKNHVVLMGYLGKNYWGMQRNPGVRTIEETLLKALLKCNLVNEEGYANLKEIHFQRAARTDKGVSAARQVINFWTSPEIAKVDLNEHLPDDIKIFAVKRVTRGFNSKNQCNGRTYRYVLPTHAFAPKEHDILEESTETERLEQLSTIGGKPFSEYRITPEILERVNSVAKLFTGTQNHHNYTAKVKPLDPRAQRYIVQFQCIKTFIQDDVEFAVLEIKGQSFLLHQIRKIVGTLVGVLKNYISEGNIAEYFKLDRYALPMAPSLGLVLYNIHYDSYNKRYGGDGMHVELDWADEEQEVEKFWENKILKHITETEIKERTFLVWLSTLSARHYASYDGE